MIDTTPKVFLISEPRVLVSQMLAYLREVGGEDALEEEIRAFLHAVRDRSQPVVSGQDGLQALEIAERIVGCLEIP